MDNTSLPASRDAMAFLGNIEAALETWKSAKGQKTMAFIQALHDHGLSIVRDPSLTIQMNRPIDGVGSNPQE